MFSMRKPCDECPFRREGGIALRAGRVEEVAGYFTTGKGGTFPCHKTIEHDDDGKDVWGTRWDVCAGGLLFALHVGKESDMTQLALRLRAITGGATLEGGDVICRSMRELKQAHRVGLLAGGRTIK